MMDRQDFAFNELRGTVRRLRAVTFLLGVVVAGMAAFMVSRAMFGMSSPSVTCRELTVVDAAGNARVTAGTSSDGGTYLTVLDPERRGRVMVQARPGGEAGITWSDPEGRVRIAAGTGISSGPAIAEFDADGTQRRPAAEGALRAAARPRPAAAGPGATQVPPPLSEERIDTMTLGQRRAALAEIARARQVEGLDEETRQRLKREFDWLIARLRSSR